MKVISTPNAPAAIGPYSQGMILGELVFCSGQIPVDPATGAVPEGIRAQAEQSCKNVSAVLAAAGTDCTKVVKTTCFLSDMANFAAFNEVYAAYFTGKPARSVLRRARAAQGRAVRDRSHRPALILFLQTAPVPNAEPGRFLQE